MNVSPLALILFSFAAVIIGVIFIIVRQQAGSRAVPGPRRFPGRGTRYAGQRRRPRDARPRDGRIRLRDMFTGEGSEGMAGPAIPELAPAPADADEGNGRFLAPIGHRVPLAPAAGPVLPPAGPAAAALLSQPDLIIRVFQPPPAGGEGSAA